MDSFGEVTGKAIEPVGEINGKDKLNFAKQVLLFLFIGFIISGVCYMINEKTGKEIFDITSRSVFPIATLVLGYYFGKENK